MKLDPLGAIVKNGFFKPMQPGFGKKLTTCCLKLLLQSPEH